MFCSEKDRLEKGAPAIRLTYERDGRLYSFESGYFDEGLEELLTAFTGMLVSDTWDQSVVIKGMRDYADSFGKLFSDKQDDPVEIEEKNNCDKCENKKGLEDAYNDIYERL